MWLRGLSQVIGNKIRQSVMRSVKESDKELDFIGCVIGSNLVVL